MNEEIKLKYSYDTVIFDFKKKNDTYELRLPKGVCIEDLTIDGYSMKISIHYHEHDYIQVQSDEPKKVNVVLTNGVLSIVHYARGFFSFLQNEKYKAHVDIFLPKHKKFINVAADLNNTSLDFSNIQTKNFFLIGTNLQGTIETLRSEDVSFKIITSQLQLNTIETKMLALDAKNSEICIKNSIVSENTSLYLDVSQLQSEHSTLSETSVKNNLSVFEEL